ESRTRVSRGAGWREGEGVMGVHVTIDRNTPTESLDGKAVAVDPGGHTLRFIAAGSAPVELTIVVREAEKNRRIMVTLNRGGTGARRMEPQSRPVPVGAYVLGAVGLASLAGFAILAVHGQGVFNDCTGNRCSQSAV